MRAGKEEWKAGRDKKIMEGEPCAGVETPKGAPDDITEEHRRLWKVVKKKLKKGLRTRDLKLALDELKVAKMAGEVLSNMVRGERLAWGIDDCGSEKLIDDTEEIAEAMASVTIPSGTDKTLDGE
ncbi:MAG: hypothetical protein BMS9Abin23_0541 [Thermodesulfobacteriota bacterium]|nr:MAG: hypothetical protein BMS9Abin23_0541 [Thermodesulfobacteriota bacterium]